MSDHTKLRNRYRWLITAAVIGLLIYVLAPQTDALWRSLDIVRQASLLPVLLAIAMTGLTYALSSEIYHMLLKHPIPLRTIALVQVATALTSRVAPIGVGTIGFNALFLRRRNHSLSEALAVVAANNGLGVIGHFLLLAIVALTAPLPPNLDIAISQEAIYWIIAAVAVLAVVVAVSARLRSKLHQAVSSLGRALASYRHEPRRIILALATSMALSVTYVLALMAAGQALGLDLSFSYYFMVYSFSILTGAATPTPGGIVGVEAGLAGGLIAYGVAADTALAVALLYRLVTYWLPLLPGFIALRVVQHKYF